jgi:thiosulfate dehydrogenase [quinone] large subunit
MTTVRQSIPLATTAPRVELSPAPVRTPDDWRTPTIPRWTIVPLRLYLGAAFLLETVGRLTNWSGWIDEVQGFLTVYQPFAAPFYRPFMTQVALPHVHLFAVLVFLGEATVALSLLLGLLSRAGASIGIFLSLNYLLSKGNLPWSFNNDFAFIAGMLVVIATRAGRTAGADHWLAQRWPRSRLW